jgi:hypothetical protein
MTVLNLGVIDLPYAGKNSIGTIDVAKKLEADYGVMGAFVELHLDDIAKNLELSVNDAIDSLMNGAPASLNPFGDAESQIEKLFKSQFLEQGEIESMGIAGVPTQASIERRSLRMKNKVGKSKRPSFVDTGLYESAFKAWVD